jgi:hypothetical protein
LVDIERIGSDLSLEGIKVESGAMAWEAQGLCMDSVGLADHMIALAVRAMGCHRLSPSTPSSHHPGGPARKLHTPDFDLEEVALAREVRG